MHFCPNTPIILVGLKTDLRNNKNATELLKTQGMTPVTPSQGQSVASKMQAKYMECSSKAGTGVEDVFDLAISMAIGDMSVKKKPKKKNCVIL